MTGLSVHKPVGLQGANMLKKEKNEFICSKECLVIKTAEQETIYNNTHFEVEGLALVHTAYLIHLSVQLLEPVHRHLTTLGIRAGTVETGVQENLGGEGRPLLDLPLRCSTTCCRCVPAVQIIEQTSQTQL